MPRAAKAKAKAGRQGGDAEAEREGLDGGEEEEEEDVGEIEEGGGALPYVTRFPGKKEVSGDDWHTCSRLLCCLVYKHTGYVQAHMVGASTQSGRMPVGAWLANPGVACSSRLEPRPQPSRPITLPPCACSHM